MRSKTLAVLGAIMLFGGIVADGAVSIWVAGKQEWSVPAPDRPNALTSKRVTRFVSDQILFTKNMLKAATAVGVVVMLLGGWPQRRKDG